jgi:hypothetical protein
MSSQCGNPRYESGVPDLGFVAPFLLYQVVVVPQ